MKVLTAGPRRRIVLPSVVMGRPAKIPRTEFGQRLVAARRELGFTQAQVAEELGITQQSFAGWERRQTALRPEHLRQLARILHVTVDYLLGDQSPGRRGAGPSVKVRQVFELVSRLPRHHQQRIVSVIEALVAEAGGGRAC